MREILVLAGKSASGKDTIMRELCNKHGFKRLVTYTSRPKRPQEVDGVDYHFISKDDFTAKARSGFFTEFRTYKMADGNIVMYGSAKEDYKKSDKMTCVILTPEGCANLADAGIHDIFINYIYANDETIKNRLSKRGDDKDEIVRRMRADREDFDGFTQFCDKITYNNFDNSLDEVVEKVFKNYKESSIWKE